MRRIAQYVREGGGLFLQARAAGRRLGLAAGVLEALLGDFATVERQLDEVKKKLLVAQTALELQERMIVHGQEPAGG